MSQVRVLGIVLFVVGLWVFLAPFMGPVVHWYYVQPPSAMSAMHRAFGMNMYAAVVNQATVFYNFLPGVVLILIGLYQAFSGQTRVTP